MGNSSKTEAKTDNFIDLKSPKVVFIPKIDEGTIVSKIEKKDDKYKIPGTDIVFTEKDLGTLRSSNKVLAIYNQQDDVFTFRVITDRNIEEEEKIKYEPSFLLGQGTYGSVMGNRATMIATKTSLQKEEGVPSDMIKEIAIYRLFSELSCLPKMYNFNISDKVELNFELGNGTLYDYIEKSDFGENQEKKSIMLRLASCLASISSQGIINCDLKPKNMIISQSGKVQIIDWGIAEVDYGLNQGRKKNKNIQTIKYRSPEILSEHKSTYSHKVDVFSLGIIFLEIVMGNTFSSTNDNQEQAMLYLRKLYNANRNEIRATGPINFLKKLVSEDSIYNIIKRRLMFNYDSEKEGEYVTFIKDENLLDLASKMLEPNPKHRIDYDEILAHPFFSEDRSSIEVKNTLINGMPKIENISNVFGKLSNTRKPLNEWMFQICTKFKFCPDTAFLAWQLVDLFIFKKGKYKKTKLQQLSCVCMMIASKIFEIHTIDYSTYKEYSDENSNRDYVEECLKIENDVIETLDGNILIPTIYSYWSRKNGNIPIESTERLFNVYITRDNVYDNSLEIIIQ